ncbi:MAG: hypothetical protein U1E31_02935 [Rickettsiales bacterium]
MENQINKLNTNLDDKTIKPLTEEEGEKFKAAIAKEMQEMYQNMFVPVLKDMQKYKKQIENDMFKNKFSSQSAKELNKKLEIIDKFLEDFTEANVGKKVQMSLEHLEKGFDSVVDSTVEKNDTKLVDHVKYLEAKIQAVFNIYLDMQKAHLNLIEQMQELIDEKDDNEDNEDENESEIKKT